MLDRLRQTVLVDPRPLLASIRAPTLLLWGERDAMIPSANATDYLSALVNARLVTFPNAGHLPQEEAAPESLANSFGVLFTPVEPLSSRYAPTTAVSPATDTELPNRSSTPVLLALRYACCVHTVPLRTKT